jgi:type II secretory pathway pseudopilin PulG
MAAQQQVSVMQLMWGINMRKINSNSAGFTLVEIAVVVPILALIALALTGTLVSIIQTSGKSRAQVNLAYDTQSATNTIEDDVVLSSSFLPTIDSTITDPYQPTTNGGAWSYLGDSSQTRSLILRTYATTTNSNALNRKAVYLTDNGCTADKIYTNDVLQTNTIYFVKNGNLYRRILTDTSQSTCSPQYQKQTCPTLESLGGSRNAICKADDELILQNVTNFSVDYYSNSSSTTPIAVYDSGADPLLVTTGLTVVVNVTSTVKASGQAITNTSTLRITRLNSNKTSGN